VPLVKNSCRKLNATNIKGKMLVPNPTILPGQVVVHTSLPHPGAPNQQGAVKPVGKPGLHALNRPLVHVPAAGQLGQAPLGAAGQTVLAAQVNVAAAGDVGEARQGAAVPNVQATGHFGQAHAGAPVPKVLAAQVNAPAAGQLGHAPAGVDGPSIHAAQVNVRAAGQRGEASPCQWVAKVLAAQGNVPVAGQRGEAPPDEASPNLPHPQGNVPADSQMVRDSGSLENDRAPVQIGPEPLHNGLAGDQSQPVPTVFRPVPNCRPTG